MEQNQVLKQRKSKLTKKQRGFVKDFALEENGTQAVMNNYDVKDNIVAKSIASENLTKPYIVEAIEIERETLKSALEKTGVTPIKIAQKINVLLDAEDATTGKKDYVAIDKGLKHATAIYGINPEGDKSPQTNTTYNFIFSPEVQANVREMESRIKEQLIKKPNV